MGSRSGAGLPHATAVDWHNDLQLHCGCSETPYRSRQPEGAPENARKNVADRREIVRLVQGRKWHIIAQAE
jgi:hypothetical protein